MRLGGGLIDRHDLLISARGDSLFFACQNSAQTIIRGPSWRSLSLPQRYLCGAVYFSGPRFDRPLKLPKLYLKIVERRSRVLDFGHRERPMLILFWPFDPGSNRDRVNVELPPQLMRKQVTVAAK